MRIELKDIGKKFNKNDYTIKDMNITINDGELVALLGPSGCGKTTTMMMIAGIYKPTEGRITFNDEDVSYLEPKDRNVGMVFQSYALYPHMTVLENIMFPLKQLKMGKAERIKKAQDAADLVRLGHLVHRKPSELSGGQQQRVALARAVVKEPKVLLLDEPLSNLDASLKLDMRTEILALQKKLNITTIIVTHDQEEAMTMADRIALMRDGKIIQYTSQQELYDSPVDYGVAKFIGTPPMNFMKGKVKDNILTIGNYKNTMPNVYGDKNVNIGVRPHEITLGGNKEIILDGEVFLIENVGYAKMITLKFENQIIRLFADSNQIYNIGEKVKFSFNKSKVQIFDEATGINLINAY